MSELRCLFDYLRIVGINGCCGKSIRFVAFDVSCGEGERYFIFYLQASVFSLDNRGVAKFFGFDDAVVPGVEDTIGLRLAFTHINRFEGLVIVFLRVEKQLSAGLFDFSIGGFWDEVESTFYLSLYV